MRKFLIIADDSPEFQAALTYACGRAKATKGVVTLLRVLPETDYTQWAGVRDEIEREQRAEAESLLSKLADIAAVKSGHPAEIIIKIGAVRDAIKALISEDRGLKILVLASASGRDPGPLISSLMRDGVASLGGGRPIPITIVPGDLDEAAILHLV